MRTLSRRKIPDLGEICYRKKGQRAAGGWSNEIDRQQATQSNAAHAAPRSPHSHVLRALLRSSAAHDSLALQARARRAIAISQLPHTLTTATALLVAQHAEPTYLLAASRPKNCSWHPCVLKQEVPDAAGREY